MMYRIISLVSKSINISVLHLFNSSHSISVIVEYATALSFFSRSVNALDNNRLSASSRGKIDMRSYMAVYDLIKLYKFIFSRIAIIF